MWSYSAIFIVNKPQCLEKIRLIRRLQSVVKDSYLHNPGSEPLTNANLGDVLAQTAHRFPGRTAIRSVYEDITMTYEELLTQADSLGCALRAQGLQKGDRLGIWSHNAAMSIVALVAAARVGLISVLLNPAYEKSDISYCINKTGTKGLVIPNSLPNRDYYGKLTELMPELRTSKPGSLVSPACPTLTTIINTGKVTLPGTISCDSLIAHSNTEASRFCNEVKPEDGSIIHLTSGTTGIPKAALDSHIGVVNNTYFTGKRNTFNQGHHTICIQNQEASSLLVELVQHAIPEVTVGRRLVDVPVFHALGSIVTVLAGFRHGSTLVVTAPIYDVEANLKALYREKCSAITGTPTMYVDMLAQVKHQEVGPPSLKMALVAGAPCSPQLIRDMRKNLNVESVLSLYGMTESTASIFQSLPEDSTDVVAETVGYIQDHVEVKVVNESGKMVPFGSAGELVARGYNIMIGYWDEPHKTKEALTEDGWLSTGDKFTINENGYGRIVGRLKDIIIRGGENIAPKEIEDLLNTHPDIIESQVVGVSDERLGEELCAVLRVREGGSVSMDDIKQHCGNRIARFKVPRLLRIIDEFPKTDSGKIQKYKIREMIEAGKL